MLIILQVKGDGDEKHFNHSPFHGSIMVYEAKCAYEAMRQNHMSSSWHFRSQVRSPIRSALYIKSNIRECDADEHMLHLRSN